MLKDIFSCGVPPLSSLELANGDRDIFLHFTLRAEKLRKLDFIGSSQDRGSFEALTQNAPVLQSLILRFEDREEWEEDLAAYHARVECALSAFLECPNLRSLQLYDSGKK